MRKVRSCGVLLFRREPELSFLLMKHPRRYDLPKGHVEAGETDLQCALRELHEETGVPPEDVRLDERFRHVTSYTIRYRRHGGELVEKEVVFFLGWLLRPREIVATEHAGSEWVPWRPPHAIQRETVDGLLEAVGRHFAPEVPGADAGGV